MTKVCSKCGEEKDSVTGFYLRADKQGGIKSHCRKCFNLHNSKKAKEKKLRIFTHYGLKCSCCGESEYEFLTIDHINNDGSEQKRKHGYSYGENFYLWIEKNNYPKDLQTLCYNCNCSKGKLGFCPHKPQVKGRGVSQ